MAIPDYQNIMLPLLKFAADQKEHSLREAIENLAQIFKLSEEEKKELLPSGQQAIFNNRVGWARTYLKKAGLLEYTKRSFFKITQRGLEALSKGPSEITDKFLEQYPEFIEFKEASRKNKITTSTSEYPDPLEVHVDKEGRLYSIARLESPEEALERIYHETRQYLTEDLLDKVKNCSPEFFERLVVNLLLKMGYGGSLKDAGKAIGQSGDGGIDGIIKEDKLGLDTIYIQAKRWESTVSRPEIHKFAGALQGQRAKKGVFITTSSFSREAMDYVSKIDSKIVLIDGEQLAKLMIDYDVGVSKDKVYEIKKIDLDYFTDE